MEKIDDKIIEQILKFHMPRWQEIPNIDLYMDQLVTYVDEYIGKYSFDDNSNEKIITKTMVNNYVKAGVLDPPVKKRYTRIHVAKLFVICVLKQIYSINDINELIKFATKNFPTSRAYDTFCEELENSIFVTFSIADYTLKENLSQEQYILKNVTQSVANKLYVQVVYLKKQIK